MLFAGFGLIGLAADLAACRTSSPPWSLLARRVPAACRRAAHAARPRIRWLRESWPLFVNQLLQGLFFKVDALLLPVAGRRFRRGRLRRRLQGLRRRGHHLVELHPGAVPAPVPRQPTCSRAYRLALRILLQVAFPLAAGIALLSEPIVALVGGREYLPDSAIALSILICYLPLSYANGLTQYVLIAAGRQRVLTRRVRRRAGLQPRRQPRC